RSRIVGRPQERVMQEEEIKARVATMMPEILTDLERLVALPSVAFPGYASDPVNQMASETLAMFRATGLTDATLLDVPSGYPPVYAEIAGPKGSPLVMLYPHYEAQ